MKSGGIRTEAFDGLGPDSKETFTVTKDDLHMNKQRIDTRSPFGLLVLLGFTLSAAPVAAQVFDSGPSDPALFDTVINVPPDPDIFSNFGSPNSVGGDGTTTQLNIFDDGSVGSAFEVNSGVEVNISGGTLGVFFDANSDSEVNISGGLVGDAFEANPGSVVNISGGLTDRIFARESSVVNISGGSFGDVLVASSGSDVNISGGALGDMTTLPGSDVELMGGEFQLNGIAFSDSTISLAEGDIFTGTLMDGSTFRFAGDANPVSNISNVTLTSETLPMLDLSPEVVSTITPDRPSGLRAGQTLTLEDGGVLGINFEAISATLNIEGGIIGDNLGATNSTVTISGGSVDDGFTAFNSVMNISGGTVGRSFEAFSTSEVNIDGGSVGSGFQANSGSVVNITGGSIGEVSEFGTPANFQANTGSVVNISGGSVGSLFDARSGSEVNISGGSVGNAFVAHSGSVVNISGGSLDNFFCAKSGSRVTISGGSVGRVFEAEPDSDVELIGGEFQLNGVAFSGSTISTDTGDVFTGTLSDGSTFIFSDNGNLLDNDFSFFGERLSNVRLTTGELPELDLQPIVVTTPTPDRPSGLRAGQTLTLQEGGELGSNFEMVNATLNIEDGNLGDNAGVVGSVVNISGGTIGNDFVAASNSEINIGGGFLGRGFTVNSGSVVNISGLFIADFFAASGSVVNVFGSDFALDGQMLDDRLTIDEAFIIDDREVILTGLYPDGTPFRFGLNANSFSSYYLNRLSLDSGATLTVTLVPNVLLGDCDLDGDVDFLDISPFLRVLTTASFLEQADCNQDGMVNFFDIAPFIAILARG